MIRFLNGVTLLLTVVICLVACGDDPNAPIYDTSANPDNFPAPALDLIDGIDNGTLNEYEAIVSAFEKLYGEHMELVDVPEWGKLISRFGVRFAHQADSLAAVGIPRYYQAAGLYALASFARPEDNRLYMLKEQFDGWRILVDISLIPAEYLQDDRSTSLHEDLELLKLFYLADSTYNLFADNFLVGPLLSSRSPEELKEPTLPQADLVFLAYAGLIEWQPDTCLARFVDPQIDLVGLHIAPLNEHQYRVETYFIPREAPGADFAVAFRVAVSDSNLYTEQFGSQSFIPFDFQPLRPMSTWQVDKIEAAVEELYFEGGAGEIGVGLYLPDSRPVVYIPIEGSSSYLTLFPDSLFPSNR